MGAPGQAEGRGQLVLWGCYLLLPRLALGQEWEWVGLHEEEQLGSSLELSGEGCRVEGWGCVVSEKCWPDSAV